MSAARAILLFSTVAAASAHAGEPLLDPDTEVARKHFASGSEHYRNARYDLALQEFELSRRAKKLPALDYNIGRCLDRLERYQEAVAAYQRYLDAAPDATDGAEVRDRVRELNARLTEAPLIAHPPDPPKPKPRWVWGAIGGAAAVVVIVAVTLGVVFGTRGSTVETWPDLNLR